MSTTSTIDCDTCYETETNDQGGREIPCPHCQGPTHKPSSAKVRNLGGHEVRYLVPTSTAPEGFDHAPRLIEVDGTVVGWVMCQGKAYGDPSLASNFAIASADGSRSWSLEGWSRDDAVAFWIGRA
jgi:hypothetical protein